MKMSAGQLRKVRDKIVKESILEVRMDPDLKEQVEQLYEQMGTSFAEAVRIFARQSVAEKAMPFMIHLTEPRAKIILEISNIKYIIPDDMDECNDEIAEMFGVE